SGRQAGGKLAIDDEVEALGRQVATRVDLDEGGVRAGSAEYPRRIERGRRRVRRNQRADALGKRGEEVTVPAAERQGPPEWPVRHERERLRVLHRRVVVARIDSRLIGRRLWSESGRVAYAGDRAPVGGLQHIVAGDARHR